MLWSYPNDQIKKTLPLMSNILMEDDDENNDHDLGHHQIKKNKKKRNNNNSSCTSNSALQASISHFNFISAWVISMIVLQPKLKKRVALLEKFMVIAVVRKYKIKK